MKFGYEMEFFLRHALTGEIVYDVPRDLPHDAAGTLVEARSAAHQGLLVVETSLRDDIARLDKLVQAKGYALWNIDHFDYPVEKPHSFRGLLETAGMHIHFDGTENRDLIIADLNARFEQVIKDAKRDTRRTGNDTKGYRNKPYGWEYRMLPATVDPSFVTEVLTQVFFNPLRRAA